ncbi:COG1215 Glycosyltransferases, probably involved in cell wall biogenesis [Mycobacteriaceae bacterium]
MTVPTAGQYSRLLPDHLSARTALSSTTKALLVTLAAVAGGALVLFPAQLLPAIGIVVTFVYIASTVDRYVLMFSGLNHPALVGISDEEASAIPDDELPVYTVLLPVYDEPSIIENLVNGVCRIDYPRDRLELLLLIEEDDEATQQALASAHLRDVRVVLVPHSLPKTKPKACNYGMSLPDLRGEYLTIYDAEDIPEPLQLRRAVAAFRTAPADIGCLQAQLGYFNERQNLLTRWFAMEYAQWFSVILPAIERARCVVPLGGTSNHISVSVWRDVGGWDEYNVTEDADLGARLAAHGYRTQILDSVTLEEANSDMVNWIRQRSRWYKGYLQTMIVHLRHPIEFRRKVGTKATLRFLNMTGGIPATAVVNIIFGLLLLAWTSGRPSLVTMLFPPIAYYACLVLFLVGTPLAIYMSFVLVQAAGKPYLWWAALLSPLYWVLQSLAAVKAFYQLVFRPFHWEKTVHGLGHPAPGPVPTNPSAR